MRQSCILLFFCFLLPDIYGQIGGSGTFAFLNQPPSARVMAMGNGMVAIRDKDLSLAWQNPSLLNAGMHNHASLNYNIGFSGIKGAQDIKNGYFAYCRHYKKIGTVSAGLLYMNYGTFDGYDPNGDATGQFKASENCFSLAIGREYRTRWSYGASLKYVYSILQSYVSNGIAADLAGTYSDTAQKFTASLVAKNMGVQAIPYTNTARQPLPFEVQLALSKKLKHMPFLYNIVFHNLQKPDFRYINTNTAQNDLDINGQPRIKKMTMGDNILRHIIIGGEFNVKSLYVRFGYNHQRRKELAPEVRRSTTGFSWGMGFRINKFNLSYGSASYFPGIHTNQFSLTMNLGDFYKKKSN